MQLRYSILILEVRTALARRKYSLVLARYLAEEPQMLEVAAPLGLFLPRIGRLAILSTTVDSEYGKG